MPSTDRRHLAPILRTWGHGTLDLLPLAMKGREDGVHDIRVAARRMRTALPLLARKPGRARVSDVLRLLRRLGDLAGPTRDLDVIGAHLVAGRPDDAEMPRLVERLCVQRESAWHALRDGLTALDLSLVQGRIGGLAAENPEPPIVVLGRLARQRDELARDILLRLRRAWRFEPESLHRLRIRVRRLRYVAEMYDEIRRLSGPTARLKGLQDAMGEIQDAWIVSRWLTREATLAHRRRHRDLQALARREAGRWTERARARHQDFLGLDAEGTVRNALRALGWERPVAVRRTLSASLP